MKRKEYLEEIKNYFVRLVTEVRINTACGHYDINKIVEDFYLPILGLIYNCPNLINLNVGEANFPAIDLGCHSSRVSFQVTSTSDSKKIANTLIKYKEHGLDAKFNRLIILIITEKQRKYSSKEVLEAAKAIGFDVEKDIIDYTSILKIASGASLDLLDGLATLLRREFDRSDSFKDFRDKLDGFLTMSKSRVEVEKNSKKYIPDIFVEANSAKDRARIFAHPVFFGRKIFDEIGRIDHSYLNRYLRAMGLPAFEEIGYVNCYDAASAKYATVLESVAEVKIKYLNHLKDLTSYCEYYKGSEGAKFHPAEEKKDLWYIYKFLVSQSASGIASRIETTLDNISLFEAKILLVTSMAGQGKTNFVCDLTDNFCSSFEIPTVLIPARELNSGSNQNIFSYLTNNRYLSGINDKFQLLDLFEKVAVETNKPFVIMIDGLNEIKNVESFNRELHDLLTAMSDYSLIKVILTCRTEFFEERFSFLLEAGYTSNLYHMKDLKSEMSQFHLDHAISSYFRFFNIKVTLADNAKEFLKSDFLLLRIFCENNEGEKLGKVFDIFKDELFESYLFKVVSKFDKSIKAMAMPVLYKLANNMIESNSLASISTGIFKDDELKVVESLVHDEIILRHELPEKGLSSVGKEYVNFTYDEIRDFIISFFLVNEVAKTNLDEALRLYSALLKGQADEGVTKYTYILSRKHKIERISEFISSQSSFANTYSILLSSFSSKYHTEEDVDIVKGILKGPKHSVAVKRVAGYLFNQLSPDKVLNFKILLDHINLLEEDGYFDFLDTIFDRFGRHSYSGNTQPNELIQAFTNRISESPDTINDNLFVFLLQIGPLASGGTRYYFLSGCAKAYRSGMKASCFEYAREAKAISILRFIEEITLRGK
ncbi:MAG TPA: hypothetical protein DDX01_05985 [Holosporales bacterium]|nr:hypothetical protein [Holosporales bacterium]